MSILKTALPTLEQSKLKLLMYGVSGSGKTTAAISMPKPYIIDTENGATNPQYLDIIKQQQGMLHFTLDYKEIIEILNELLFSKHNYQTLVLDSSTVLYNGLMNVYAKAVGTDYSKHRTAADLDFHGIIQRILKLPMHVVVTAHVKDVFDATAQGLEKTTHDGFKKLDYIFDLCLEITKKKLSKERVAMVRKSRFASFVDGEEFIFSYPELLRKYSLSLGSQEKSRVQAETAPLIKIAPQTLIELRQLTEKVSGVVIANILAVGGADSFEELSEDFAVECIAKLREKRAGAV